MSNAPSQTRLREQVEGDDKQQRDERCPECEGDLVPDAEHGETVCSECGLVVEAEEIDPGPEWRSFDNSDHEQKSRVGAPTTKLRHDKGLSTNIGWQDKDAYGNTLSARQREKMQRLRTWNERFRTRDARERNLKQALSEINRMSSALGLPENVRETASVIYRRALEENLLPGRSIEGVASASLYAAARNAGTPRSLDELARVSRVDRSELTRAYRYIIRELELEVEPADPESYVPRFLSELGVTSADAGIIERHARDMLTTAREEGLLSGKSPVSLAAAAIYAAALLAEKPLTQQEIGDVADISEVTIRNRYRELLDVKTDFDIDL